MFSLVFRGYILSTNIISNPAEIGIFGLVNVFAIILISVFEENLGPTPFYSIPAELDSIVLLDLAIKTQMSTMSGTMLPKEMRSILPIGLQNLISINFSFFVPIKMKRLSSMFLTLSIFFSNEYEDFLFQNLDLISSEFNKVREHIKISQLTNCTDKINSF